MDRRLRAMLRVLLRILRGDQRPDLEVEDSYSYSRLVTDFMFYFLVNEGAIAKRRLPAKSNQQPSTPPIPLTMLRPPVAETASSVERQGTGKVKKLRKQIIRMQKELDNERRLVR